MVIRTMRTYLCIAVCMLSLTEMVFADLPVDEIKLPDGFKIEVFADELPNARSMVRGEKGSIFVGTRKLDRVYALSDEDGDGRYEKKRVIAQGLTSPNGVAMHEGNLYVAEISRILRFDDIEANLDNPPKPVVIRDDLPTERAHGWKYIAFGPDGLLYVPIGAPGNIVLRKDPRYSSVTRMKPDGTNFEVFAHGIRNTVGFDWHPETNVLWFTDNGRDWLGDDSPPDELNKAPKADMHFGYPFWHGNDVKDPQFGDQMKKEDFVKPEQELGPHVAALGMKFYRGEMFPDEYRGQIFIAEHGSWNRSTKIGYRVMLVKLNEKNEAISYEPFATGWLRKDGSVWGRPVDVLEMPDGSLLVSDDYAGAIYRISYAKE